MSDLREMVEKMNRSQLLDVRQKLQTQIDILRTPLAFATGYPKNKLELIAELQSALFEIEQSLNSSDDSEPSDKPSDP